MHPQLLPVFLLLRIVTFKINIKKWIDDYEKSICGDVWSLRNHMDFLMSRSLVCILDEIGDK